MVPGSPTYAIRNLQGTLAWDVIRARHRLGATLIFASAATISIGAYAPYEIYKVAAIAHAVDGLNFFGDFGLHISFIPHWNNAEGGADLDTSRCFIGMDRFAEWCDLVPVENQTIGLDEHTGLIVDIESGQCEVSGVSSVSIVRECDPEMYPAGSKFKLSELGDVKIPSPLEKDIPPHVWEMVVNATRFEEDKPSDELIALAEERLAARANKNWAESDRLRDRISELGWTVQDAKDSYKLVKS
ncbi:MAG: hypothetical protein U0X87_01515 [Anaerolineales bacterium]